MRSSSILLRGCLAVALTLGTAAAAHAASLLFTPPMLAGDTDSLNCHIVNVSTKTRTVTTELFQSDGVLRAVVTQDVAAGRVSGIGLGGSAILGLGYCKFTVEGGKSNFRAAAKISNGATDFVIVPAQ